MIGKKSLFPDFNTFKQLGFKLDNVTVISNDLLELFPFGDKIKPIPIFRQEDFMYHMQCEDPDRMVRVNAVEILKNKKILSFFL